MLTPFQPVRYSESDVTIRFVLALVCGTSGGEAVSNMLVNLRCEGR